MKINENNTDAVAFLLGILDKISGLTVSMLIEKCFTPLSTIFQSHHGDSSHYSCLYWVSPVLGWGSEVSCPRTLPRKNPEDPVRLEPRTPGLRVKHFTTEPRRTPFNCFKLLYEKPSHLI